MEEKHRLTITVSSNTWKMFTNYCNTTHRSRAKQIERFLYLMSGESQPDKYFPLESKLFGAFFSRQEIGKPSKKGCKVISFPTGCKPPNTNKEQTK